MKYDNNEEKNTSLEMLWYDSSSNTTISRSIFTYQKANIEPDSINRCTAFVCHDASLAI